MRYKDSHDRTLPVACSVLGGGPKREEEWSGDSWRLIEVSLYIIVCLTI